MVQPYSAGDSQIKVVYNDSVAKIFSKAIPPASHSSAVYAPPHRDSLRPRTHRVPSSLISLQHPEEDTQAIVLNADCLIFDATLPPPMSLAYCLGLRQARCAATVQ